MRLLLDECFSHRLAATIATSMVGADIITIKDIKTRLQRNKNQTYSDEEVFNYAVANECAIITHNGKHFINLIGNSGKNPGLIHIEDGNIPLDKKFDAINVCIQYIIANKLITPYYVALKCDGSIIDLSKKK